LLEADPVESQRCADEAVRCATMADTIRTGANEPVFLRAKADE
jgi:hypothetical protein